MTLSVADIVFVLAFFDGALSDQGVGTGPCRAGYGFTLLIPAITGYCSEFSVTSAAGSLNPQVYLSEFASGAGGITTNEFNIVGVALQVSTGAGTAPSGGYIGRTWQDATGSAQTIYVNCPSNGNFMSGAYTATAAFTAKDSNQVSWTINTAGTDGGFNHSDNSTLDDSSMCSLKNTDSGSDEFIFRDIYNTKPTNPVVVPAACPSPSTLINSGTNKQCQNGTFTGTNPQTDAPDITPLASGDLIIAASGYGTGPSISNSAPSGALYDCGMYTTQSDQNGWCWGEGHSHYYTTSTTTLNWGWNMGTGTTVGGGFAVEIQFTASSVTAPPAIREFALFNPAGALTFAWW
jgi:hypothetical protein